MSVTGRHPHARATIRDIADRAGVSIATVSRVLNGRPDVAPDTREAVLEVARQLRFSTNRSARSLSGGRTGLIGVTIPIGMLMGFHMFVFRKGHIREATIIGVVLLLGAVIFGRTFAESSYGHYLVLTRHQVTAAMAIYALAASILPIAPVSVPSS